MNEGRLVESKRQFREAGADEEQLVRFDRLSDMARFMCCGLIRRQSLQVEEALQTVERVDANR